jgi:hypothetical protein
LYPHEYHEFEIQPNSTGIGALDFLALAAGHYQIDLACLLNFKKPINLADSSDP